MEAAGAAHELDYEAGAEWVPGAILGRSECDLLLVDIMMPGMGGIELLRHLAASHSTVPVIILSSLEDKAVVREAFSLGAVGYLSKTSSIEQVLDAIEHCSQGNLHFPDWLISDKVAVSSLECQKQNTKSLGMTRRQLEVISLIEKGLSNQEIADQLFISKATVKTHLHQLFRTLGVKNRVSCLREARQRGLTEKASGRISLHERGGDVPLDQGA